VIEMARSTPLLIAIGVDVPRLPFAVLAWIETQTLRTTTNA
jgi:hypothetical protein